MLTIEWNAASGWKKPKIQPFGNLSLHPASSVLHYALEVRFCLRIRVKKLFENPQILLNKHQNRHKFLKFREELGLKGLNIWSLLHPDVQGEVMTSFNHVIPIRGNWFQLSSIEHESHNCAHLQVLCVIYHQATGITNGKGIAGQRAFQLQIWDNMINICRFIVAS